MKYAVFALPLLPLILVFIVLTGCQEAVVDAPAASTNPMADVGVDAWFADVKEVLEVNDTPIHFNKPENIGASEDYATLINGLIYREGRFALNKTPEPDCSVSLTEESTKELLKFRSCFRDVLADCPAGADGHIDDGDMHIHSRCD